MSLDVLLTRLLLVIGAGFLVANLRIVFDFVRFLRLRSTALLTWPGRKPPLYGLLLGLGVVLGLLIVYKLGVQRRPPMQVFGEAMMFLYYGYLLPLSLRIGRGFYEEGIWAESGFMPYSQVGALKWRESEEITLILISRARKLARRLVVPQGHYGEARRLLRDKIAVDEIHLGGTSLDLGAHDARDDV